MCIHDRIRAVVDTNILFRGLGEVEKNVIVDAMERKTFEPVCGGKRSFTPARVSEVDLVASSPIVPEMFCLQFHTG